MAKPTMDFSRLSSSKVLDYKETQASGVSKISVEQIDLHESQPRATIDEVKLQELTDSIKANGMLQAIGVVRKAEGDGYYIAYGQRRWLAHKRLGEEKILARIYEAGTDIGELSIIENYFKEDLSPIEEARAFDRLAKDKGWNNTEMGKFLGMDRRTIGEIRAITKIDSTILDKIENNADLTKTHLVEIARAKGQQAQQALYDGVVSGGVTTRDVREGRAGKSIASIRTDDSAAKITKALARQLKKLRKVNAIDSEELKAMKKQHAAISREIKRLS